MKKICFILLIFFIAASAVAQESRPIVKIYLLNPEYLYIDNSLIIGALYYNPVGEKLEKSISLILVFVEHGCLIYPVETEDTNETIRFVLRPGTEPMTVPYDGRETYEKFVGQVLDGLN
jgi:hypothetical protein